MVCGTIKWFDRKKGFGFIAMGDEEVFVHYTNIVTENGRWLLDDGVEVTFELGSHNGKPTAVSVTVSIPSVGGGRSAPLAFGLRAKNGRQQHAATAESEMANLKRQPSQKLSFSKVFWAFFTRFSNVS